MVVVVRCPERSVERGSVLAAQRKSSAFLGGQGTGRGCGVLCIDSQHLALHS